MEHYNKLTYNRKLFINQLYNLISSQFNIQDKITGNEKEIIEELENNFEYIQRIFIDAPWGMGKSYFASSLIELINKKNEELSENKKIEVLRFNAWETDYFSDPMKSLIGELNECRLINSEISEKAKRILTNVGKEIGIKLFRNLILKKFNFSDEDINEVKSFFSGINESGLEEYKNYKKLINEFKESLTLDKKRKIIIIDELDRCRPVYAIELLETIKHIFGVKNIIFIFLINKKQLKSIVSTMYLSDSKYSEYFEKFYDIQFELPEIDYKDFINIEYQKYEKLETYNVENNISKERDIFWELLFLEAFKSNFNNEDIKSSVRLFLKIFKKYKLLLNSLSDEEKTFYLLIILLIIYFLEQEFNWNETNENRKIVFLKTFFFLKNPQDNFLVCKDEELFEKYELKEKFIRMHNSLNFIYKVLCYESGKVFKQEFKQYKLLTHSIILHKKDVLKNMPSREDIVLCLEEKEITIKNLNIFIWTDPFDGGSHLLFPLEYFNKRKQHRIALASNFYHINLLFDWCKEKYNFIMKNKESLI